MPDTFDARYADSQTLPSRPDLRPVTIVSADSHACLPPNDYKKYLESKYHEEFGGFLEDLEWINKVASLVGYPTSAEELAVYDRRGALVAAGEVAYFDPVWRLRQTEAEGVAAEFLHPFGAVGFTPFADVHNSPRTLELRAVGGRAHNRFLEEFCSEAPGRLLGVPWIHPWPDWDAAVQDMKRAREAGFRAIFPPVSAGSGGDLPAFYDPFWEPMWAACQDLGLAVHIHAGFGNPQGGVIEIVRNAFGRAAGGDGESEGGVFDASMLPTFNPDSDEQGSLLSEIFETFVERRPLWQLMWSGVFDRFPGLKVAFVEVHGDWVPATLAYLDAKHAADPGTMKLKPSEYWQRHCAVGASLMRHGEVAVRHQVGIDKLMFGTDFPHKEGTWPNTHDWIRATLAGVPEAEARRILGENAIDFYGLDRTLLEKTAKRIGPLPGELFNGQPVDTVLARHFAFRGGIDKPVAYSEEQTAQAFEEDLAGARAAVAAS